jgi:hypothetical protein
MNPIIKVSPSDFAFLYEECSRCYWEKLNNVFQRPMTPFPMIFQAIDKEAKRMAPARLKHLGQPRECGKLISKIRNGVQINGKLDSLLYDEKQDGYWVVDYKVTRMKESNALKYERQLSAYAWTLENQNTEKLAVEPKQVLGIGIFVLEPGEMFEQTHRGVNIGLALNLTPQWLPLEYNRVHFERFLDHIASLANGPCPARGDNCSYCKGKPMNTAELDQAEANSEKLNSDLGFSS